MEVSNKSVQTLEVFRKPKEPGFREFILPKEILRGKVLDARVSYRTSSYYGVIHQNIAIHNEPRRYRVGFRTKPWDSVPAEWLRSEYFPTLLKTFNKPASLWLGIHLNPTLANVDRLTQEGEGPDRTFAAEYSFPKGIREAGFSYGLERVLTRLPHFDRTLICVDYLLRAPRSKSQAPHSK